MTPRKVLIVEDEMIVQMHLRCIVDGLGHEVTGMATTPREALEAAGREAPELVLMDVRLAEGGDGIQTAQELRDRFDCALLFITAHADEETVDRSQAVGATGYIVKPFTDAEVRASISTALAGHGRLQQAQERERSLTTLLGSLGLGEPRGAASSPPVRTPFGDGTRLVVYSHDTFGLGHLRRSMKLIQALVARHPSLSCLLVTGSPMVHRYAMPTGTDYLKLPAVRKVAPERYEARSLSMSGQGIHTLRSNLLLRTIRDYEPNVLLVDHSPVGMSGEILPALEWLGEHGDCTRILGLRDVIDEPQSVIAQWREQGIYDVLRRHYEHVVVYGTREVYDPVSAYEFPDDVAEKTHFVHYVSEGNDAAGDVTDDEEPTVVVTVGGGDGGAPEVIGNFLEMMRRHRDRIDFKAEVLMGPFLEDALAEEYRALAEGLPVVLHTFVSSPASLYRRADVVIGTAGYNTTTELLANASRAILIPRVLHRDEQLIRARRMEELELMSCLHPDEVTPDRLFDEIQRVRASGEPLARAREAGTVPLDGAERLAEFCGRLLVSTTR